MQQPSEAFHGGRPASAEELRLRFDGSRSDAQVIEVGASVATTAYGGELRVPVHPLIGSVSSMAISWRLEPGERTSEAVLPISECGLCVVQGRGRILIGEDENHFYVGDLAFVPVQGRFAIENTGGEPMVILGLISPPDANILRAAGLWIE
ncbi:MAG: hypothetical protein M1358_09730 [Chloroflexi bacterium]|nr:hypothetical protein [Chloroflexota bacterium]